jgi:hypothetical protein
MASVYLETTIPSYLAARPSRDLVTAAHQQITHEWWDTRRASFGLYVSQLVIDECSAGDPTYAARRISLLTGIPTLILTDSATELATELILQVPLPEKARADALHVGLAVVHRIDYLLTWNCSHLANVQFEKPDRGRMPIVGTPTNLNLYAGRTTGVLTMPSDLIVAEVRERREALLARFNYDLQALVRELKQHEAESGRKLVSNETAKPNAARPLDKS